jgi:hypothetical protein
MCARRGRYPGKVVKLNSCLAIVVLGAAPGAALLAGCAGSTTHVNADAALDGDGAVIPDPPDAHVDPTGDGDVPDPEADASTPPRPDANTGPQLPLCDFMAPSFKPPGGLSPAQVPQFIVLGVDDNRYVDGLDWLLDEFESRHNPAGHGNARTHDGAPITASFYFMSIALESGGAPLLAQWQRVVNDGHEVGNHTYSHEVADWQSEIDTCDGDLVSQLGVDEADIIGFRAPYLNYQQPMLVYPVLQSFHHFKYDCTLRHDAYYDYLTPGARTDFYLHIWPYTLDHGADIFTAGNLALGNFPGLWELPPYALPTSASRAGLMQPSNNYTGFDSTAYGTVGISGAAFENSLKWALDLRLQDGDNRAPMIVGLHSDTYSTENDGYPQPLADRRAAVEHFLDYALTKPDVRFVSAKQLIQWMCSPTPL